MPRRPMDSVHVGGLIQKLSTGSILITIPPEEVEKVLRETGTESLRTRLLPAPVTMYLVLLLGMHAEVSVRENLGMLLEPLRRKFRMEGIPIATGGAITKARKRLGAAPFVRLFDTLAKPMGHPETPGCFWKGYRLVAADGTTLQTQDTEANRLRFGCHENQFGAGGYPQIKAVVMVECGTRIPLGCAWGGGDEYEPGIFDPLRQKLEKDMIFLVDRAYYSFERWQACAEKAGALLWRVKSSLEPRPVEKLADGSWLAEIRPSVKLIRKGLSKAEESAIVRVIEYRPRFDNGQEGELVRLFTTLLDPKAAPAEELANLYSERWETETGFDELKNGLIGPNRVLRSQLPELVEQELYGYLLSYYAVRATMAAAAHAKGYAPNELSFIHAVRVIQRRLPFPPCEPN
ncbi:MAG: IS4 family transposase [Candidatus Brocadiia bacterium]